MPPMTDPAMTDPATDKAATAPGALDLARIRETLASKQGRAYWQSLEELADTQEFREFLGREFPRQAVPLESALDRRDFLKLLGASLALAGLTSCVRPVREHEKIVPYVRAPEEIIPGKPLFFATAVTQGGYALGVLAESHQGRPTKLEGNPDHPASLGATDAITQATVLSLYDPDRSQSVLRGGAEANWQDFTSAVQGALQGGGQGLRILTETVTSPTLAQQLQDVLAAYPGAVWHQYDPLHEDNALAGAQLAFGQAVQTTYDLSQADVILSLDGDFLGRGPGKLRYSKDFSRRRRALTADADMSRLYVAESVPSITGAVADHRLPVRASQVEGLARALAGALGVTGAADAPPLAGDFLESALADLQAAGARSLVVVGESQPPAVHALAHAINAALGNVGTTVVYRESPEARPEDHRASLSALVADMTAGAVETLLILGGNPAYTAPPDLGFAGALAQVPLSVHLSHYLDETSALTTWHLPQAHYLETWSDARAYDGTVTIMQPLIAPFYGGRSEHEVLAALLGNPDATGFDLLQSYWQGRAQGDFDAFWRQALYAGVVAGSEAATLDVSPSLGELPESEPAGDFEVVFQLDHALLDGRYANNGWLQELPKPLSKIVWDNAAYIGASTAERLGVTTHDRLSLRVGDREVLAPVWVLPGVADGVVAVQLGYGRAQAGRIGTGVGFDAGALRDGENLWLSGNVQVARAAGRHKLVSTQMYYQFDGTTERRHLIRHGTLAEYRAHPDHPDFVHPVPHHESDLYPDFVYTSYQWGMVIDQTVCTGCNACMVACQAENNVPIVGKRQVEVGRDMHWIRIDTYYGGDLDNPEYYLQPVTCMHCEKAPCEPVCPVGATLHDNEGLNVMVYNRCVGTRYCSNNCPYKVRRFNFLQYAELSTTATELSLAYNPDVTVRSRGVMEKCTYCIQRIQQAYITSENEGRRIRDGEVIVACQGACPTEAIVFGDIADPGSLVAQVKTSPLNYTLLEELNTVPRTSYLARVRNTSAALEGVG